MTVVAKGLNVNRVVNVTLTIAALAAGYQNFGAVMAIGSDDVIDTLERIRTYNDFDGVVSDFGVGSPVTAAAELHFSQVPRPNLFYVGRWAQFATPGLLRGAILTGPASALSRFTVITAGSMAVTINGTAVNLTGVNLSGAVNLNGVASAVQAAIRAANSAVPGVAQAVVKWDGQRFTVASGTTGAASVVSFGSATGAGTDMTAALGLGTPAATRILGLDAEPLVNAISILGDVSSEWYAASVATTIPPTTIDHLAAAGLIEASARMRVYALTTADTAVLDPARSDDVCSQMKQSGFARTLSQFSSWHPFAVFSLMGRFATVNFAANNSTITLKFKQEPGVVAESLTATQADALEAKNCNVFVNYSNGRAILEQGVMASGVWIDERQGCDWVVDKAQTDLFNLEYQSGKIPQTNAGNTRIVSVLNNSFEAAVNNGFVGPGQWNGDPFGTLLSGDFMPTGYYVFAPDIRTQAQADREKRKSVPIQGALKLQGAIHSIDLAINVNR
jgi:hypothetical protein